MLGLSLATPGHSVVCSPVLGEIQGKWIDLSVFNSTDIKHSKNTYFAKLEGIPQQLTILQYSQQIRTFKLYLFLPKIPGTRALGGHLWMYEFVTLAAAQRSLPLSN